MLTGLLGDQVAGYTCSQGYPFCATTSIETAACMLSLAIFIGHISAIMYWMPTMPPPMPQRLTQCQRVSSNRSSWPSGWWSAPSATRCSTATRAPRPMRRPSSLHGSMRASKVQHAVPRSVKMPHQSLGTVGLHGSGLGRLHFCKVRMWRREGSLPWGEHAYGFRSRAAFLLMCVCV